MWVRGAAVRHIIMSDSAMLHTNRLIPVSRVLHGGHANIRGKAHKDTIMVLMLNS